MSGIGIGQPIQASPGTKIIGTALSFHAQTNPHRFWIDVENPEQKSGYFVFAPGPGITCNGMPITCREDVSKFLCRQMTTRVIITYPATDLDDITEAAFEIAEDP